MICYTDVMNNSLYHAYVIVGSEESARVKINELIERAGLSPEFHERTHASFGIDEVRELKRLHSETHSENKTRMICVSTSSITHPAQNALLKLCEEPNPGTHLFIVVPRIETFLPTLLSRVQVLHTDALINEYLAEAQKFFDGTMLDRITIASNIHTAIGDMEKSVEGKNIFLLFLNALEVEYAERLKKGSVGKEFGKHLYTVRSWSHDLGVSSKNMLEFLALAL